MLQETISIAERRNNRRDIPYSCCWCWEGILQDEEGFSPHKGAYLRSPHCLDDTETHNPSKLIAKHITWAELSCVKHQNRKRLGHNYTTDNQDGLPSNIVQSIKHVAKNTSRKHCLSHQ